MRGRETVLLLTCLAALVALSILAVAVGAVDIATGDVVSILSSGRETTMGSPEGQIVWSIRLPRLLMGILVGSALAVSGAALQGLFRNPLADPYVLGIASGGAFGAALALWLNTTLNTPIMPAPIAAFVGSLVAALAVFSLSYQRGRLTLSSLLLSGVAVGLVFSALLSLVLVLAARDAGNILGWLLGYLGDVSWSELKWVAVTTFVGLVPLFAIRHALDGMLLGEDGAASTGIDIRRIQYIVLGCTSLLVAGAVAFAGLIGFIGLIVPHMIRLVVGPRHSWLLPIAAVLGAVVLVGADITARTLIDNREIPVGIITGCLGGPFFLILLRRSWRHV